MTDRLSAPRSKCRKSAHMESQAAIVADMGAEKLRRGLAKSRWWSIKFGLDSTVCRLGSRRGSTNCMPSWAKVGRTRANLRRIRANAGRVRTNCSRSWPNSGPIRSNSRRIWPSPGQMRPIPSEARSNLVELSILVDPRPKLLELGRTRAEVDRPEAEACSIPGTPGPMSATFGGLNRVWPNGCRHRPS